MLTFCPPPPPPMWPVASVMSASPGRGFFSEAEEFLGEKESLTGETPVAVALGRQQQRPRGLTAGCICHHPACRTAERAIIKDSMMVSATLK